MGLRAIYNGIPLPSVMGNIPVRPLATAMPTNQPNDVFRSVATNVPSTMVQNQNLTQLPRQPQTQNQDNEQPQPEFRGLLRPLEDGQEIAPRYRETLNPLQRLGVFLIENCYQRIGIKQMIWGKMSEQGMDVCAYSRRAKQMGVKDWQSCSQYTKMAIVRDGFIKGCFEGLVRISSCNPVLFYVMKNEGAERFIERHSRIVMPDEVDPSAEDTMLRFGVMPRLPKIAK